MAFYETHGRTTASSLNSLHSFCRVLLPAGALHMHGAAPPGGVEDHSWHGHPVHAGPSVPAIPERR